MFRRLGRCRDRFEEMTSLRRLVCAGRERALPRRPQGVGEVVGANRRWRA